MPGLETNENIELRQTPDGLKQRSLEFFRALGGKSWEMLKDDSEFISDEALYLLTYGSSKLLLSSMMPSLGTEVSDTLVDEIYGDSQLATMVQLGPVYIKAFLRSGAKDMDEFIDKVKHD